MVRALLDSVLYLNQNLLEDRRLCTLPGYQERAVEVPGEVGRGVRQEVYDEYRRGLDGACADIVVTSRNQNGKPVVVATRRAEGKCFGGKWWMQGGAIPAYCSIPEFVRQRAAKECGAVPDVQALIGVFRTCAEDIYASTIQPCYVGWVGPESLVSDDDHCGIRLLTLADLDTLPLEERHWYPMMAFRLALETMP